MKRQQAQLSAMASQGGRTRHDGPLQRLADDGPQTKELAQLQRLSHGTASRKTLTQLQALADQGTTTRLSRAKGANQVIQRVPLGIFTGIDDARVELNTNAMDGIRAYVTANERNNRQDLNRLLVEAVRTKDRPNLRAVQQEVNAHQADDSKRSIPKVIHMIWIGDAIGGGEIDNILSVYESIRGKDGWGIKLWTDSRKCGFLDSTPALLDLSARDNFEINRNLQAEVDDSVSATYDIALAKADAHPKGAFTMMSDLARYSVLLNHGGIYMDVDLNLGKADVSQWNMEMSKDTGLPAFGPNIQYISDLDANFGQAIGWGAGAGDITAPDAMKDDLEAGVQHAFRKMFEFKQEDTTDVALSDATIRDAGAMDSMASDVALSRKTRIAAMAHYMQGNVSNNLVAAPKNHKFLKFMINKISDALEAHDGDFDPGKVAQITGPTRIMPWITLFYGEQDEQRPTDNRVRRALMEPVWVSQLIAVEWQTAVHKLREQKERGARAAAAQEAHAAAERTENAGSGCCYITTACVAHMGLPDDCEALTVLRSFRDGYLMNKPEGKGLIKQYYQTAPAIVSAIHDRDEEEIWERLYGVIKHCVAAIKAGDNDFAFRKYCEMVLQLESEYLG